MEKLFILILLGTNRKNAQSAKVAQWVLGQLKNHPEVETQLFDPSQMDLTFSDYGEDLKDQFLEWKNAVVRADGLIIISPEYNHGYPGTLKMILDTLFAEYNHKAVGLIGVSDGPFGGARMIEQLVGVVKALGLSVTKKDLYFPKVDELFDDSGNLKMEFEKDYADRFKKWLPDHIWLSRTLRWGRENLSK